MIKKTWEQNTTITEQLLSDPTPVDKHLCYTVWSPCSQDSKLLTKLYNFNFSGLSVMSPQCYGYRDLREVGYKCSIPNDAFNNTVSLIHTGGYRHLYILPNPRQSQISGNYKSSLYWFSHSQTP